MYWRARVRAVNEASCSLVASRLHLPLVRLLILRRVHQVRGILSSDGSKAAMGQFGKMVPAVVKLASLMLQGCATEPLLAVFYHVSPLEGLAAHLCSPVSVCVHRFQWLRHVPRHAVSSAGHQAVPGVCVRVTGTLR
jgi:hypothetical protein